MQIPSASKATHLLTLKSAHIGAILKMWFYILRISDDNFVIFLMIGLFDLAGHQCVISVTYTLPVVVRP